MNNVDVYDELARDLLMATDLGLDQAREIVRFLQMEGHIDYDQLKEYYLDE